LAYSIGKSDISRTKVQHSTISDIAGNIVPAIVDQEKIINAQLNELTYKKQEIVSSIEKMDNELFKCILVKRYVHCKKWEKIASELHYSDTYIFRLRAKALKAFEDIHQIMLR
jgi:hypothetical protein